MKTNRKTYSILIVLTLFIASFVHASFPVKENNNEIVPNEKVITNKHNIEQKSSSEFKSLHKTELSKKDSLKKDGDDEKLILVLLWFFLGVFAAHRWYKKKPVGWNILFILTIGGCGIWAIVDLVNILLDEF